MAAAPDPDAPGPPAGPIRLAQITDPHIGARWFAADPLDTLAAVLGAIDALPDPVDGLIVTGDLAADGEPAQYAALAPVLAALPCPVWVLPGNHDDRAALRAAFGLPGAGADPVQHVGGLPGLRVLLLDTTVPGEGRGELAPRRLAWLADALAASPDEPTLLAMHHPPFPCGVRDMDRIGLSPDGRAGLAALLGRHPQLCGLVAGHNHRTVAATFAGRPALVIPGTYGQFPLSFGGALSPVAEPLAFAVHTLVDGRLVSHVQTLTP